jgi:hypothetical protein
VWERGRNARVARAGRRKPAALRARATFRAPDIIPQCQSPHSQSARARAHERHPRGAQTRGEAGLGLGARGANRLGKGAALRTTGGCNGLGLGVKHLRWRRKASAPLAPPPTRGSRRAREQLERERGGRPAHAHTHRAVSRTAARPMHAGVVQRAAAGRGTPPHARKQGGGAGGTYQGVLQGSRIVGIPMKQIPKLTPMPQVHVAVVPFLGFSKRSVAPHDCAPCVSVRNCCAETRSVVLESAPRAQTRKSAL